MQRRRHVDGLVIIVRAFDFEKVRTRVRSHQLQEVGDTRAAKRADHVPALHADMARILAELRQRLNLGQRVFARMLHVAFDRQRPLLQIHLGVENVVAVVGELFERHNFGIRKCLGEMLRTKRRAGGPIAEANSFLNQTVPQLRDRERSQDGDGSKLEQLAATLPLEFLVVESSDHERPSREQTLTQK